MFLALPMFSFSFQYLILQKVNIQNTWWSMDFSTLSNIEVKDNDCAVYFMFQLVFFIFLTLPAANIILLKSFNSEIEKDHEKVCHVIHLSKNYF